MMLYIANPEDTVRRDGEFEMKVMSIYEYHIRTDNSTPVLYYVVDDIVGWKDMMLRRAVASGETSWDDYIEFIGAFSNGIEERIATLLTDWNLCFILYDKDMRKCLVNDPRQGILPRKDDCDELSIYRGPVEYT